MSFWGGIAPQMLNNNIEEKEKVGDKLRSNKRIGPHSQEILSILFGTLLGDSYAEKRAGSTHVVILE